MLDHADYYHQMMECLESLSAEFVPEFDFGDYNGKIRAAINKSKHLLDKEPIRNSLLLPNPSVPRIYGLPKVHKEGSPLRPVVSFVSAPSYLLVKFLDNWFKQVTCFHSPLSIKNSVELVSDLTQTPPPHREAPLFRLT